MCLSKRDQNADGQVVNTWRQKARGHGHLPNARNTLALADYPIR